MAGPDPASLWGEVGVALALPVTPLSVLREYAASLGLLTKNIVTARVSRGHWPSVDQFVLSFNVVAPVLTYSHALFYVVHPATKLYPAEVRTIIKRGSEGVPVEDEAALRREVERILRAPETTEAVKVLLAQSLAETNDFDAPDLPEDLPDEPAQPA